MWPWKKKALAIEMTANETLKRTLKYQKTLKQGYKYVNNQIKEESGLGKREVSCYMGAWDVEDIRTIKKAVEEKGFRIDGYLSIDTSFNISW